MGLVDSGFNPPASIEKTRGPEPDFALAAPCGGVKPFDSGVRLPVRESPAPVRLCPAGLTETFGNPRLPEGLFFLYGYGVE